MTTNDDDGKLKCKVSSVKILLCIKYSSKSWQQFASKKKVSHGGCKGGRNDDGTGSGDG